MVRIAEYDRPMASDDIETGQTIAYMDEIAARDAEDPAVQAAVSQALEDAGIGYDASPMDKAAAVFYWLKRTVRYVPTPGTSPLVDQTLIAPCTVLAMPEPIGDCPQFSMLASAMFRVLCMESRFVTIAAESSEPDLWSHVYNTVEVYPHQFLPFDSSNGPEPGAEYSRPFKKHIWPRITPGRCRRSKESMMHTTHHGRRLPSMRNRALHGTLGDDGDTSVLPDVPVSSPAFPVSPVYSTPPVSSAPSTTSLALNDGTVIIEGSDGSYQVTDPNGNVTALSPGAATGNAPAGGSLSPGGSSASGSSSLLNTIVGDAAALGSKAISAAMGQPYYITGPNGQQILYNPATGQAVSPQQISPTILIIGIGLVALLMFAGKGR